MEDPHLEHSYALARETDPRAAAEMAYVLAVLAARSGNFYDAHRFGSESAVLFQQLNIETLEDAEARYTILNGVVLPDLIHEAVVRDRLALLGVNIE